MLGAGLSLTGRAMLQRSSMRCVSKWASARLTGLAAFPSVGRDVPVIDSVQHPAEN